MKAFLKQFLLFAVLLSAGPVTAQGQYDGSLVQVAVGNLDRLQVIFDGATTVQCEPEEALVVRHRRSISDRSAECSANIDDADLIVKNDGEIRFTTDGETIFVATNDGRDICPVNEFFIVDDDLRVRCSCDIKEPPRLP